MDDGGLIRHFLEFFALGGLAEFWGALSGSIQREFNTKFGVKRRKEFKMRPSGDLSWFTLLGWVEGPTFNQLNHAGVPHENQYNAQSRCGRR